jgi:hypothetical protein
VRQIHAVLTPDLVYRDYRHDPGELYEKCCYPMTEAFFHFLGGRSVGLQPMNLVEFDEEGRRWSHWWLQAGSSVIDLSNRDGRPLPGFPYEDGRKRNFQTPTPSRRARTIMSRLRERLRSDTD